MVRKAVLALAALLAAIPAAAAVNVVSLDFDTPPVFGAFPSSGVTLNVGGGSIQGAEALPGFGSSYFHSSTSTLTELTLTGLAAHTSLTVSFDIAFIDTWDGNDETAICCNPDYLFITFDGAPAFALSSNNQQGLAPQYQGGALVAIGDYAQAAGFVDAVVRYDGLATLTFAHTGSTFTLGFQAGGDGWQGDFNDQDESWGLDNVAISAEPVPEPGEWTMLVAGLAVTGIAARRRKRALA